MLYWLVVEPTPLKNISQNGNLPQIGVKIKNLWKHHLVYYTVLQKYIISPKQVVWNHTTSWDLWIKHIILGCPRKFVSKWLGSVGYNPNILHLWVGEITHWSKPLILTSWDIQVPSSHPSPASCASYWSPPGLRWRRCQQRRVRDSAGVQRKISGTGWKRMGLDGMSSNHMSCVENHMTLCCLCYMLWCVMKPGTVWNTDYILLCHTRNTLQILQCIPLCCLKTACKYVLTGWAPFADRCKWSDMGKWP